MKTTTRNVLAVPVISRSRGSDEGKVIAVRCPIRVRSTRNINLVSHATTRHLVRVRHLLRLLDVNRGMTGWCA